MITYYKFRFTFLIWISESFFNLSIFLIPTILATDFYMLFLYLIHFQDAALNKILDYTPKLFYWLGYNWFGEFGLIAITYIFKKLNILNFKLGLYLSKQNTFFLILNLFLIHLFFVHCVVAVADYWSLFYIWKYGKFVIFRNFVVDSIFATDALFVTNFILLFFYFGIIKKYSLIDNLLHMFYAYFFFSIYCYNIGWLTYIKEYHRTWPTEFYLTQKINYTMERIPAYDYFNLFCPGVFT